MAYLEQTKQIEAELKDVLALELDLNDAALSLEERLSREKFTPEEIEHLLEVPDVEDLLRELVENDPTLLREAEDLGTEIDDSDEGMHRIMERELKRLLVQLVRESAGLGEAEEE